MIDPHVLAFAFAGMLVVVTPGLDTALVLRTVAAEGPRAAAAAAIGICTGCLAWGLAASAGLGALLAASNALYTALRVAGAAYLLYLGVRMIIRPRRRMDESAEHRDRGGWFTRGLLTNLLNPKVGAFYVTFLPQFVPPTGNVAAYSTLFTAIHAVEGLLSFAALITASRPLRRLLAKPRVLAAIDRVAGALFIAFGARLALQGQR